MPKFLSFFLMIMLVVSCTKQASNPDNGNDYQWPDPAPGCQFFTQDTTLSQTQSSDQLAEYLSTNHFEHDLDGWFFFGSLEDDTAPDDPGVFVMAIQRIEVSKDGFRIPMVPAIVAFNSASLGQYTFRGFVTIEFDSLMTVQSNPWKVTMKSPLQSAPLMTMQLVSGTMGVAGAEYRLTADIPDLQGVRLQVDVQLQDRFGVINQGYGATSFFPQYITAEQREEITENYTHSVSDYLEATGDPMSCQGSYYYSMPLIDVEHFSIMRDSVSLSAGSSGLLWMDYVVQTYDQKASEAFSGGSWGFYAIQFPERNMVLTVIEVTSATGSLPVATLFNEGSEHTRNGARKALHSYAIDEITIEPVPGTLWTSPVTGQQYPMQHHIQLGSADWTADLTIEMIRDNQEIVIDTAGTIKYEGIGSVRGTLGGQSVNGKAFLELQPVGHF